MPKLTPKPALSFFKVLTLALAFLLCTPVWVPSTMAFTGQMHDLGNNEGTYHGTLEVDEYVGYVLNGLDRGDSIEVNVVVNAGEPIDAYLFSSLDFQSYVNDDVKIVPPLWGEEVIRQASGKYDDSIDEMVLVIDNTDISRFGAKPEGPVTYTVTIERHYYQSLLLILLLILTIVGFIIAMAAYRIRRRNRRRNTLYAPEEYNEEGEERRIRPTSFAPGRVAGAPC